MATLFEIRTNKSPNKLNRFVTGQELEILSGVSSVTISNIENGDGKPTLNTMKKISEGLGVKLSDIDEFQTRLVELNDKKETRVRSKEHPEKKTARQKKNLLLFKSADRAEEKINLLINYGYMKLDEHVQSVLEDLAKIKKELKDGVEEEKRLLDPDSKELA